MTPEDIAVLYLLMKEGMWNIALAVGLAFGMWRISQWIIRRYNRNLKILAAVLEEKETP